MNAPHVNTFTHTHTHAHTPQPFVRAAETAAVCRLQIIDGSKHKVEGKHTFLMLMKLSRAVSQFKPPLCWRAGWRRDNWRCTFPLPAPSHFPPPFSHSRGRNEEGMRQEGRARFLSGSLILRKHALFLQNVFSMFIFMSFQSLFLFFFFLLNK